MKKIMCVVALCFGTSAIAADIDLRSHNSFNPDCSYRVHLTNNGITSQAVMVSKDKIVFDTVVDSNKFTDLDYQEFVDKRFVIHAKNKRMAFTDGTDTTQEYLNPGEYQIPLINGSYITEHSCSQR